MIYCKKTGTPDKVIIYVKGTGGGGTVLDAFKEIFEAKNAYIVCPRTYSDSDKDEAIQKALETNYLPLFVVGYSAGSKEAYLIATEMCSKWSRDITIVNCDGAYPYRDREILADKVQTLVSRHVPQVVFRGVTNGWKYYEKEGMITKYYAYNGDHATIKKYMVDTMFSE